MMTFFHFDVAKLLFCHGANVNIQDNVSVNDMIYMSDVYVLYVCVYDCMINLMPD